jgi:hypothetical protein
MRETVRSWIIDVIRSRHALLAIPVRQRAKFEGWLKFELAAHAATSGARDVRVESASAESSDEGRPDVSFTYDGVRYVVELKTANTNWRLPGVENATRPITKNIADIVKDAKKLVNYSAKGLVAFVLFPIPPRDRRWEEYLGRISAELGVSIQSKTHTTQVSLELHDSNLVDLVVCCFAYHPQASTLHVSSLT